MKPLSGPSKAEFHHQWPDWPHWCKSRENVVEQISSDPALNLFEQRGLCSVHGTKVFIPSVLLCSCCCTQERKELQSMKQLFGRAPFCVGRASSSPDNREAFLLCFLLVLAMTPASQICSCSGHTTHNKARMISAVFADPWAEPKIPHMSDKWVTWLMSDLQAVYLWLGCPRSTMMWSQDFWGEEREKEKRKKI